MEEQIKAARARKRARYLELGETARKVCELLENDGVSQHEGCIVRRMAEDMWHQSGDIGLSNVACDQPVEACPS